MGFNWPRLLTFLAGDVETHWTPAAAAAGGDSSSDAVQWVHDRRPRPHGIPGQLAHRPSATNVHHRPTDDDDEHVVHEQSDSQRQPDGHRQPDENDAGQQFGRLSGGFSSFAAAQRSWTVELLPPLRAECTASSQRAHLLPVQQVTTLKIRKQKTSSTTSSTLYKGRNRFQKRATKIDDNTAVRYCWPVSQKILFFLSLCCPYNNGRALKDETISSFWGGVRGRRLWPSGSH